MKIVSFINNLQLIKKILLHLALWEIPPRAPPRSSAAPQKEIVYDYSFFDALVNWRMGNFPNEARILEGLLAP